MKLLVAGVFYQRSVFLTTVSTDMLFFIEWRASVHQSCERRVIGVVWAGLAVSFLGSGRFGLVGRPPSLKSASTIRINLQLLLVSKVVFRTLQELA